MTEQIYIVIGSIGSWDDTWEWPVCATHSEGRAETIVQALQEQADAIRRAVVENEDVYEEGMPRSFDGEFPYNRVSKWETVDYRIWEVDLDDMRIGNE